MAITYQRNTWETGKVITAKALNDIETGIVNIVEKLNDMDTQVASQALTVEGNAKFNGPVEIKGATTVKNNITVESGNYIILSESPNNDNHAVTKAYVDGKTINSANDGITATGTLGEGISIELKPASTTALGGIKVGQNLTIDSGELDVPMASANTNGLMSKAHFTKLEGIPANATNNTGTVTSVKINNITKNPTDGTVDIGNIVTGVTMNDSAVTVTNGNVDLGTIIRSHQDISSKANLDSPTFSGIVNFGNQISIDANDNKITINQTDITEQKINALYNLPSIPPLSSDNPDGTYVLQATKNTPEGATPVITYSWVQVPEQESGGEGS